MTKQFDVDFSERCIAMMIVHPGQSHPATQAVGALLLGNQCNLPADWLTVIGHAPAANGKPIADK